MAATTLGPVNPVPPARPEPHRLGALADAFGLRPALVAPGWRERMVRGVRSDNRLVTGGELFAAQAGGHVHGARFAARAVAAGAAAVVTDLDGVDLLRRGGALGVPVLVAGDLAAILGSLAAQLYDHPAARIRTFAVTGTNGKTTTTYLLEAALGALGRTTGLIGTVELRAAGRAVPARLTTPQAADLQELLAGMVQADVQDVAMEVSSHALALGRVDGITYDVAGFTNLSQDHLDFHGDLESYYRAKACLFTPAHARAGVVLVDDAWGRRLAGEATVPTTSVTTSDGDADWRVAHEVRGARTELRLRHRDGTTLTTSTTLPGTYNVANAALALVMAIAGGVGAHELEAALADGLDPTVPGRTEQLSDAPRVVVDFAHNPDALAQVLAALRPTTRGRLVVLFGAPGERDRTKRPQMGRVAALGADEVVVTDDDPHEEPADRIRAEILAGIDGAATTPVREIVPRQAAIRTVVLEAGPEDTVLVAGRGHETVQEISGVEHHLDDREEVRAALAVRAEGLAR